MADVMANYKTALGLWKERKKHDIAELEHSVSEIKVSIQNKQRALERDELRLPLEKIRLADHLKVKNDSPDAVAWCQMMRLGISEIAKEIASLEIELGLKAEQLAVDEKRLAHERDRLADAPREENIPALAVSASEPTMMSCEPPREVCGVCDVCGAEMPPGDRRPFADIKSRSFHYDKKDLVLTARARVHPDEDPCGPAGNICIRCAVELENGLDLGLSSALRRINSRRRD